MSLTEVANSERTFPAAWIAPSGYDVTDDFVRYARPLVGNDMISLPIVDGRQRLTRFQPIYAEKKLPAYVPQGDASCSSCSSPLIAAVPLAYYNRCSPGSLPDGTFPHDLINMFNLTPKHRFLVGIDSDGCVFDTMEVKHKECFTPNMIKYLGLPA